MAKPESANTRSWQVTVYLTVLSVAGIGLAATFLFSLFSDLSGNPNALKLVFELAVLTAMLSLCRSFPLPTLKGQGADISIILLYATFILKGVEATVLAIVVSAFFTFDRRGNKDVGHIFNTSIVKTLFNNSNYILAISAGWLAFGAARGVIGNTDMPAQLLPSLLFLVTTLLVNSINMFIILKLTANVPFFRTLADSVTGMLPTLLTFAPIGYFLARIFNTPDNGAFLSILFFVPLMFARYAFKLYVDSKEQYLRTISTLTTAIEAKDEYTEGHSKRVAQVAVELAQAMGLGASRIDNIQVASVLHDIGKIGIEDEILRKPGKLSPEEWAKIEQHPSIGVKILEEVVMPELVKEIIHYHHVRYDRKGYPKIAADKKLPLEVHIVSLADAYDAMTSDRPYRKALSQQVALDILKEERGTQFHPDVVDAFLKMNSKERKQ